MPQLQPDQRSCALGCLTAISVVLFVIGLGCNMAGLNKNAPFEVDIGCTVMMVIAIVGGFVIHRIRGSVEKM